MKHMWRVISALVASCMIEGGLIGLRAHFNQLAIVATVITPAICLIQIGLHIAHSQALALVAMTFRIAWFTVPLLTHMLYNMYFPDYPAVLRKICKACTDAVPQVFSPDVCQMHCDAVMEESDWEQWTNWAVTIFAVALSTNLMLLFYLRALLKQ